VRAGSTNLGDPSRVYVRKAQYGWRWDWGPELMTAGPYRPISLRIYHSRLSDVHVQALGDRQLNVSFSIDGAHSDLKSQIAVSSVVASKAKQLFKSFDLPVVNGEGKLKHSFTKDEVDLWFPFGYGEQALYNVQVVLLSKDGERIHEITKTVGFRDVKLIQEPLEEADQYGKGTTFLFEVNGTRIFCGGSNWIPGDNFLTRMTAERYRDWLELMKRGSQNMVRIWGGGIYEPDVFFDICDELGIMVWHDFQFACGVYPKYETRVYPQSHSLASSDAQSTFGENVRQEVIDNVKRLRHHASLAIWCGNNEDYQMILQWDLSKAKDPEDLLPARKLYEHVFPELVEKYMGKQGEGGVPYWFGSPYGGKGWDTADPTVGDVHQWDIWGGKERPYQDYDKMGGRFVSEFGMPSFPVMRTIDWWMDGAPAKEYYAQSPWIQQHVRAGAFERRFAIAMCENFRVTEDLESYTFHTQVMQSDAVGHAYASWRRAWKGKGREFTSGVLVWQLNDCWPVVSWALVDSFLRPKPAFYTIARSLAPVAVGIFREVEQNRPHDRPRQYYEFGAMRSVGATVGIWGTTSLPVSQDVTLSLSFYDLQSSWHHSVTQAVTLHPNQSTEIISLPCPSPSRKNPTDVDPSATVVVSAKLVARDGTVLARYTDFPQPYRYLEFPDPGAKINVDYDNGTIEVDVQKPVKALFLEAEGVDGREVEWSDNAIDVVPGDKQTLKVKGLRKGGWVKAQWMGKPKSSKI
ncbi:glycoside hydrolase family 2 protein, partial [Atractiella rhizophila]